MKRVERSSNATLIFEHLQEAIVKPLWIGWNLRRPHFCCLAEMAVGPLSNPAERGAGCVNISSMLDNIVMPRP